jgi:GrpB-like predicted nucleotidyltransferase (UPF0157 family)
MLTNPRGKVCGFVVRQRSPQPAQLLVVDIRMTAGLRARLPGGSCEEGEHPDEGVLREVREETGLATLQIIRRLGVQRYFKPYLGCEVERYDYLLRTASDTPDVFSHSVTGKGADAGCIFDCRWIDRSRIGEVDDEYSAALKPVYLPEFFADPTRLTLRPDAVVIEPYSAEWPGLFRELAGALRRALGDAAIRIDHIGSTAVPGLAAKPIIDVQISVRQLEPVESYGLALVHLGYRFRPDNDDPSRRYFREGSGRRRTHVHVRQAGSPDEQRTLLFRDYLRADRDEMRRYEGAKRRLATQYRHRRRAYVDAKGVIIEKMLQRAEDWAHRTEWLLSPSDA